LGSLVADDIDGDGENEVVTGGNGAFFMIRFSAWIYGSTNPEPLLRT